MKHFIFLLYFKENKITGLLFIYINIQAPSNRINNIYYE